MKHEATPIHEIYSRYEELEKKLVEKDELINYLYHQISILQKIAFGKKSEKLQALKSLQQLSLEFEGVTVVSSVQNTSLVLDEEQEEVVVKKNIKPRKQRVDFSKLDFPEHLRREVITIEPLNKEEGMVQIGEEVTELLATSPSEIYIKRIIRPKYAFADKSGVLIGELPSRAIPYSKVDESTIAFLLSNKLYLHLPLDRQRKIFYNQGLDIKNTTIGDWFHKGLSFIFEALHPLMLEKIKASYYLQCDETKIRVLIGSQQKGSCHQGYYWVFYDPLTKLVIYEYYDGRGKKVPEEILKNNKGYYQTDGYAGYLSSANPNLIHLCCMAHARRKFVEAEKYNTAMTQWMLEQMAQLYHIEKIARDENYTHEQRFEIRQQRALPVLEKMKIWMDENKSKYPPKSPISLAINYSLERWDKLCVYVSNGILEIDNNLVENSIRPVAIGRKNYMFAGSQGAAINNGFGYSMVASCIINNIDPQKWFEAVLRRLPDTKKSELHKLLPLKQNVKELGL